MITEGSSCELHNTIPCRIYKAILEIREKEFLSDKTLICVCSNAAYTSYYVHVSSSYQSGI